jgi:hypothetical protein
MSTDHPFADSVGAYAIGALDADERRAFEAHLSTCARCQADLRDMQKVNAALAITEPRADPPASLRASTISYATAQPQEPPGTPAPLRGSAVTRLEPAGPKTGRTSQTGVLDKPRVKGPLPRWVPTTIAASLGAAVLAGVYAVLLSWQVSNLRQMVQDSNDDLSRLRNQLDLVRQDSGRLALIARIATAADVKRVLLAGRDNAAGASAHAFWSPTQGIVFNAERLPQLDPTRVYQLWALRGGKPFSVGVFRVGTSGAASFTGTMPPNVAAVDALAVSVELDPGVPAPTGPIVLIGNSN